MKVNTYFVENNSSNNSPKITEKFGREKFLITGIGASAGGIKALKEFLSNVPADSGVAYVVILHLSPEFESKLSHILQSVCVIPVIQITDEKLPVQPNHVYVIPPNRSLAMIDGYLQLSARESYEERRAPIDIFFRTLADSNEGRAVAVVLSGTGSDGSMGMKRVKERGGIVLVQDPDEAEYEDMPRNSIAQGMVNFVLKAGQMPGQIIRYSEQRSQTHIAVGNDEPSPEEEHEKALREIFTQLRGKTGHDFSNYKRATILRRIERRMNVREIKDLTAYAMIIQQEKDESVYLLKDLLISVTNFFRDKSAFEALERDIIPKIFAGKTSKDVIRIWVAACATGEEAYSMAMLCAERLSNMSDPPVIQIFGSDIDNHALNTAREGFYTNADVADVSPERLRKFFTRDGEGFRIRRELRETILFAMHNILKDPPFSRLDLASCRNLLIYLNRSAQDRVINTFHFALNPGGYLFLGSSETIDGNTNIYATINREYCVFQSRAVVSRLILPAPEPPVVIRNVETPTAMHSVGDYNGRDKLSVAGLHQQILELYAPPSIVVNAEYDIIHISKNAGRFLQLTGEPSFNLLTVIRPELRLELRGGLYNAAQSRTTTHISNLSFTGEAGKEPVDIIIRPVTGNIDTARGFLLVVFQSPDASLSKQEDAVAYSPVSEPIAVHLEEELVQTRLKFRNLTEQHEVQTEEFKASNEELQAINEELRSAGEELETSREELQSVNEELSTVNQELKIKIEELSQANNDFKNLISATNIGTIFLDRSFSVNLFTPAACKIFNLKPADYGRPLSDITNHLLETEIDVFLEKVLSDLQPVDHEVDTIAGDTFIMRILPYRTPEDHINGLIITFIDITARKAAEESLRNSEEHLRAMFNQAHAGVLQTDLNGDIIMVNKRFCEILGYEQQELLHSRSSALVSLEDGYNAEHLLKQLIADGKAYETEQRCIRKDKRVIWLHNNATLIHDRTGAPKSILHIAVDISSQKLAEEQKDEFIGIASHELKTPVTSIKGYAEILEGLLQKNAGEQAQKIASKLNEQIDRLIKLIKELLDTTRVTAGKLVLHKSVFNLQESIKTVVDIMQYTSRKHKLQLELTELPLYNGDKDRIEQILTNLIDNAIKYAPDDERIIISCGEIGGNIKICVKDSGPGLSGEHIEKVFDRFFRADNHAHSNSLGLGLFISMETAKLHGGTITVESPNRQGAKFCLVLPLNDQQNGRQEKNSDSGG